MNADREFDLNLIKRVFLSALTGMASRRASHEDRTETLERLRRSLLEALSSGPIDGDPVRTMRLRATIAAGFEAAVLEAEKQRLFVQTSASLQD
ncbi:hypothetical protein [Roseomonas chloroacetimidivorans]|jgi:hypothetical protein|uniref:hypothetical protein n=1 Tax=Roseomonas chloroacetimidivorans TaxID=1766656 RepID=UPI003C77047C